MPKIILTNNTNVSLTASSDDGNATLNRYLLHPFTFLTPAGFDSIIDKKIAALNSRAFPLTAKAATDGTFAAEGSSLDVQVSGTASLGLLVDDDMADLLAFLKISNDSNAAAVVSFEIEGNVSVGPTIAAGDFSFGITSGATVALTSFCMAAGTETFGDAVKRAIAGLTIPHDIGDLKSLPVNAICKVNASSSLTFDASLTYSFLNNALATVSIAKLPSLGVNASASATVEATATHAAEHTVTIAKLPNSLLHLAVNLTRTDDFGSSLTISAGIKAKIGDADALAFLLKQISPDATTETAEIAAEMPPDKAEQLSGDIKDAIDSALSSSFQASLKAALDDSKSEKQLFLYEIDLSALDQDSAAALQSALTGDFTRMTRPSASLAGIRVLDSALITTFQRKHSLAIHLLGIFNFQSTNAFVEKSKVNFTKDTHEIVLSDETVEIETNNLESEKLREVLLKGITLTLPASANTPVAEFPMSIMYFERKAATDPLTMLQFANVLQITGSPATGSATSLLAQKLQNFGTASLSLSLNLSAAQCREIFLDDQEEPYDWTYYLSHACAAAVTILDGADETASLSRLKLFRADETFWKKLESEGAVPNQVRLLKDQGIGEAASADVTTFLWWSSAMGAYAKALAANQSIVKVGMKMVKDSTRGFNEPWLILTFWNLLRRPAITSLFTCSLLKSELPLSRTA